MRSPFSESLSITIFTYTAAVSPIDSRANCSGRSNFPSNTFGRTMPNLTLSIIVQRESACRPYDH